ncbi:MAG: AEC family transporter [Thermoflexaceae bacterium]|nr:AEC family transporter [Thermoflexaceae bacterium]
MDVQVIVTVMMKLFMIMALGFLLNKVGIIDKHTNTKLSGLISKITSPLLIISSVLSSSPDNRMGILKVLAAGFSMYIVLILFAKLVCILLRFPKKDRPLYECMLVFSNNSFMGFPVLQSLLGDEAIFYSAMIHFSFNILIFSYGINNIAKCGKGDKEAAKFEIKNLINPGFILTMVALVIYLSGFRSDGIIYDTVYMVGNVTSPLSMIVLGASLAMYPVKESISDWRSYVFSVVRLFVIPLITFAACRIIGINEYYTTIVTVTNAMPVASLVLMLGNQAEIDTSVIIRNIFVTTVLATLTVPILVTLLF